MTTVLIDGNNVAMRCIMATAAEDLSNGVQVTGGIYGFIRTLSATIRAIRCQYSVTRIVLCWDHAHPQFRTTLVPEYKQARAKARNDMTDEQCALVFGQVATIRDELCPIIGVQSIRKQGYEADDLIYAMSRGDEQTIIVSGDRDFHQLIDGRVSQWYLGRDGSTHYIEPDDEQLAVPAYRWVLYRALRGDDSDGIPGVAGVGDKRAHEAALLPAPAAPLAMAVELVRTMRAFEKPKRWQQSIVCERCRIDRNIRVMDLSCLSSYVPPPDTSCAPPSPVDIRGYMKFCAKLHMRSLLVDPMKTLEPVLL